MRTADRGIGADQFDGSFCTLNESIGQMRNALDVGDLVGIAETAHGLRGSSTMIGAIELRDATALLDVADLGVDQAAEGLDVVLRQAHRFAEFDVDRFIRSHL